MSTVICRKCFTEKFKLLTVDGYEYICRNCLKEKENEMRKEREL